MEQERHDLIGIGAFAAESRLSQKALRLYATLGLLVPRYVAQETGYRYYHPDQLQMARVILLLRQMDLPLAQIRRVLAAEPQAAADLVRAHLREREARLERARRTLSTVISMITGEQHPMSFEITVREVGAQPIVAITRHVTVDGLIDHITGSHAALSALLQRRGVEPAGPPFGIYVGPVNNEDQGPMRVCVPIPTPMAPEGDVEVETLPAARMACVTMRGAQCDFPAILEGYDAVYAWIEQNGYKPAASPREIWLSAPGVSGTPDEALEVAWAFEDR